MVQSTGPDIALFKRFSQIWSTIKQETYECMLEDDIMVDKITPYKQKIIQFCLNQLLFFHARDDYKEFIQLCLLCLGEKLSTGFCKPGAFHRTRWMAKIIYCLKMYMFQS